MYDGRFEIPTFDEVIELAQRLGKARGRDVGIYPETKHPTYFRRMGLPLEERLIASLDHHGWNERRAPVFIQSFESANLRALRASTAVRLVQLLEAGSPVDDDTLKTIASYADVIGPEKTLVQPVSGEGLLLAPTDLVERAHRAGLAVHVWTLRRDREFLPSGYRGDAIQEFRRFRRLGVDGVFTDFPDLGVAAYRPDSAARGRGRPGAKKE